MLLYCTIINLAALLSHDLQQMEEEELTNRYPLIRQDSVTWPTLWKEWINLCLPIGRTFMAWELINLCPLKSHLLGGCHMPYYIWGQRIDTFISSYWSGVYHMTYNNWKRWVDKSLPSHWLGDCPMTYCTTLRKMNGQISAFLLVRHLSHDHSSYT